MKTGVTALASLTTALVSAAEQAGLNRERLLVAMGLTEERFEDPDDRVPLDAHLAFWREVGALPGVPGLEIGRRVGVNALGVAGFAARHCETLGEALAAYARHRGMVLEPGMPFLQHEQDHEGRMRIVLTLRQQDVFLALRHPPIAVAASAITILREVTGQSVRPLAVELPVDEANDAEALRAFYGAPLRFGAPALRIDYDAAIFGMRLPLADPELQRYLARYARRLAESVPTHATLSHEVQRLIDERLGRGVPSAMELARALRMSRRTMHRRLAAEGTNLKDLVDRARRRHAEAMIASGRASAKEIAFALGYSEPSAFFRAFRRWTSTTPKEWWRRG